MGKGGVEVEVEVGVGKGGVEVEVEVGLGEDWEVDRGMRV